MSRKVSFALSVRKQVTEFDDLIDSLNVLSDVFADSGYDSSGSDPIVDGDLNGLDMTAADLAQFSQLVTNLNLFMQNGTPAVFDYAASIKAFRSV